MRELIKKALEKYPNFHNLTIQQQYEILKKIDPTILKEEVLWYYEDRFGWPFNTKQFKISKYGY